MFVSSSDGLVNRAVHVYAANRSDVRYEKVEANRRDARLVRSIATQNIAKRILYRHILKGEIRIGSTISYKLNVHRNLLATQIPECLELVPVHVPLQRGSLPSSASSPCRVECRSSCCATA